MFRAPTHTAMPPLQAAALLPILAFLACGTGDPPPTSGSASEAVPTADGGTTPGAFEVTLTGDVRDRFTGGAHFTTFTDEEMGGAVFILAMGEGDDDDARTLVITASGGRPAVGEHPFADPETMDEDEDDLPPGYYSAQLYSPGAYMVYPRGGTLRITESTASRLAGTFSFSARGVRFTGHPPAPTGEVQVEGRFQAVFTEGRD
jgi:hypothetical protein